MTNCETCCERPAVYFNFITEVEEGDFEELDLCIQCAEACFEFDGEEAVPICDFCDRPAIVAGVQLTDGRVDLCRSHMQSTREAWPNDKDWVRTWSSIIGA